MKQKTTKVPGLVHREQYNLSKLSRKIANSGERGAKHFLILLCAVEKQFILYSLMCIF